MGSRFGFRYRSKRLSPTTTAAIFISVGSQTFVGTLGMALHGVNGGAFSKEVRVGSFAGIT
jgi:hypothetical protein